MTVQHTPNASLASHQAANKIRLKDPETGDFLHLSGVGRTRNIDWSWLGTRAQARTLRDRARTRGEDWPWRAVPRDEAAKQATDPTTPSRTFDGLDT